MTASQFDQPEPRARRSDPASAHDAANAIRAGNDDLIAAVRHYVFAHGPSTQEEIAIGLVPDESVSRWRRSSVISACARARLTEVGSEVNRRGRRVAVWAIPVETAGSL